MSGRLAIAISGSVCTALLALTGCAVSAPRSAGSATSAPGASATSPAATGAAPSSPVSSSLAGPGPSSASLAPARTGTGYLTVNVHELVSQAALVFGGPPVEFIVTLRNRTQTVYRDITPLVSIGHCTSFSSEPVPMAPSGTLAEYDPVTGGWRSVSYDKEGTGMDYILADIVQQPPLTLLPGASVSFTFRITLSGSQPKPYLRAGLTPVNVTVIQLPGRQWIGSRPAASVSVATIRL